MGKIIDLPELERPREKALRYGINKLSDYELLALLISSGCKEASAVDIAYQMLSENNGLSNLVTKPFSDLVMYKGMGKRKAIKIEAAFEIARRFNSLEKCSKEQAENSLYIYQRYKDKIISKNFSQEMLYLIILDKRKRILHEINMYKGNENSVNCSSRQIIQQILLHNGHYFYLIHNHPSGMLEPSEDDVFFTVTLINECKKLEIEMVDHLIISPSGYYSFLAHESYQDI